MKVINMSSATIVLPNEEILSNRMVTEINKNLSLQWKKDSQKELINTKKPTPYEIEQRPKKLEMFNKAISLNQYIMRCKAYCSMVDSGEIRLIEGAKE